MAAKHEEENTNPRKTIFVRNLPFTTTNQILEDEFSGYGPIKKAFVVKDKDNISRCRGFGYVQFVLQDDADKAASTPKKMENRSLNVCYADKKPKHEKRKREKESTDSTDVEGKANTEVEEGVTEEIVKPLARKPKANKVHKQNNIVPKAPYQHATTNQTGIQIATEFQRTVVLTGLTSKVKRKAFRILCETFGEIENIVYPVPERSEVTAFVRFKDVKSAVRASQKIPGKKVRKSNILSSVLLHKEGKSASKKVLQQSRIIVRNISFKCDESDIRDCFSKFGKIVNISVPTKVVRDKTVKIGCAFIQFENPKLAQMAITGMNLKKIKDRPVVVDWAISKDKYEEQKKEANATGESTEVKLKDEEEIKEELNETGSDDEKDYSEEEDNDVNEDLDEEDEDDEDVKPKIDTSKMKDAKEGKTVFIRNLAYETDEDMITEKFEKYGDIEYCKVVIDHATGRSKGSAFIKFATKESAGKCVQDTSELEGKGKSLVIDGRPVKVSMGVTRGKIMEIERQESTKNKETDKRNLSLAYEGLITKNTPGAELLSDADLKRREKALSDKKKKLKDPNFFVSRTRLCFRNLPLATDSKELQGILMKQNPSMKINSIKIMRNKDRKDTSGQLRSLGFGFVEIEKHEDALKVLRSTNNNPDLFGEKRRLIVEFSIENSKALKILETRRIKANSRANLSKEDIAAAKKRRGEKWHKRVERFKQRREDRKNDKNVAPSISTDQQINDTPHNKESEINVKKNFKKKQSSVASKPLVGKPVSAKSVTTKSVMSRKRSIEANEDSNDNNNKRVKITSVSKDEKKFNDLVKNYKKKILQKQNNSKGESENRWFE